MQLPLDIDYNENWYPQLVDYKSKFSKNKTSKLI